MDCHSIILCESSTALTLEDCHNSKVKLGGVIFHDYQLLKDCLANPVPLLLFRAINFVFIALL